MVSIHVLWTISEPSNPTIVGSIDSLTPGVMDVYVVESKAYLANHSTGIVLVDISNPETPTIIDSMETLHYSWGIYVSDYIYLSDGFGGLIIISYNPCEGDFDSDGDVDGSDLAIFAADFGRTDCPCTEESSVTSGIDPLKREIQRLKTELAAKNEEIAALKGK